MAPVATTESQSPRSDLQDYPDIKNLSITESILDVTPCTPITPSQESWSDYPIPSIESLRPESPPTSLLDGLTLEARNTTLSPPAHSIQDSGFRDSRRRPSYKPGKDREGSPNTYRKLYNSTPEPPSQQAEASARPIESANPQPQAQGYDPSVGPIARKPSVIDLLPPKPKKATYEVKDEVPPYDEPYFDPDFQKAIRHGKNLAGSIESVLLTCDLAKDKDSQIHGLMKNAKQLKQFVAPAVCTIGVVGDSGAGKSSLINSLLDEPDLAETAGLGAACTNVVTEYRLKKSEHTSKYTVEVDCMTDAEIDEQLRELLWSYRQFHLYDLKSNDITVDEQQHLADQSNIAWSTLHAAFGHEKYLTESYLQDKSPGAEEKLQEQLVQWTKQLKWPTQARKNGSFGSAKTIEECNDQLERFRTGNLWPFVKVVRVYLSSQILKSGAILADLPGFHDSNHARVKAAEDYIFSCDEIFVVADIVRVTTNKNVEELIRKTLGNTMGNSRPSQGISLICTKSEIFNTRELKKRFVGHGKRIRAEDINVLEKDIQEAEANDEKAGALHRRDKARDKRDHLLMTARNHFIEELLLRNHAERFSGRSLSVFCISNTLYMDNRDREREHDLLIQASGIRKLRRFCHKVSARAQFRVANHFLGVRLKDMVQRVQMWLTGGSQATMPNDTTIQKLLVSLRDELQTEVSQCIETSMADLQRSRREIMTRPMSRNSLRWTEAALEAYSDWGEYHHSRFAAICRGNGSYQIPGGSFVEWNLEVIKMMTQDMSPWWDALRKSCNVIIKAVEDIIQQKIENMRLKVEDFHGAPLFAQALHTKRDAVAYVLRQLRDLLYERLLSIKRNATQNHGSAYIYELMRPTYRACNLDSGTGVTNRRMSYLRGAIGSTNDPILFNQIRSRLRGDLLTLFVDIRNGLRKDTLEILTQIGADLEMLRGTEAKLLAKNGDFLGRLEGVMKEVLEHMVKIEGSVKPVKKQAERDGYF
ncbi:MAG: hypothetical protein M1836_004395 [Candelina mexicana]|nr:MAG: hypothetical protein M1836_004395 [Candelina mexicana]